jgi:uncharacterized protein (TIGR02466 family)
MIADVKVTELFPTPIWSVSLKADVAAELNARLMAEVRRLTEPRPPIPSGTSWQTDPAVHRLPGFAPLVSLVGRAATGAMAFLGLRQRSASITGMWININPPGARNSGHTHPNNFLSGVYYVETPVGEDRIDFADPRAQAEVMMPPVAEGNRFNGNIITMDVRPGLMILFPAWLRHSVPINRSNADRISIAFNLMVDNYTAEASPPLWRGTVPIDPRELA